MHDQPEALGPNERPAGGARRHCVLSGSHRKETCAGNKTLESPTAWQLRVSYVSMQDNVCPFRLPFRNSAFRRFTGLCPAFQLHYSTELGSAAVAVLIHAADHDQMRASQRAWAKAHGVEPYITGQRIWLLQSVNGFCHDPAPSRLLR